MMRRFILVLVAAQCGLVACTCGEKPTAPTLQKLGESCGTDDSCETGLCDGKPGAQAVCVKKCASGCSTDEICTQLTPERFSCQKDPRKLCTTCQIDSDCPYPADKCVVVNGEKVCGRDCAFDQNCPTDYSCRNALGTDGKAKLQQCTPTVASCACLARGDLSQPCSVTNSIGTCKGVKTCDLVSNSVSCNALVPASETCNGIDDNCNGTVDEGGEMKTCGVGACERTVSTCSGGVASVCTPGNPITELCNGIDDDCDTVTDNGFPVEADVNNCGACGKRCSDTVKHATPTCSNRMCGYSMCDPGWVDRDGDKTNGCEAQCGTVDLPDSPNFIDENCDGIDGELNNGIFVAPNGSDTNDGTREHPKKTLSGPQGALVALGQSGKRDIYIATGTYTGPLELNLTSDMVVAGGYDPVAAWQRKKENVVTIQGGNPALRIVGATNLDVQLIRFVGDDATLASPGRAAFGGWVRDSSGVKMTGVSIVAGKGADGTAGTVGAQGAPGEIGKSGGQANVVDARGGNIATACNVIDGAEVPVVGAGGASSCMQPGGAGGNPSHQDNTDHEAMPQAPVATGGAGHNAPNGGGVGGVGVPEKQQPSPGNNGANGSDGLVGAGGAGASYGTFTASGWVPGDGRSGLNGTAGKGGGGGGGGAGGWAHFLLSNYWCQAYGSAGGGGGSGGCGGEGGKGGLGGGAAVALFVVNSTITGAGNSLATGSGGSGGAGGAGGVGGTAGAGAESSLRENEVYATYFSTRGGSGGNGGLGGRGGDGSGGAGGSVYGIVRNPASVVMGSFTAPGLGSPGLGGSGAGVPLTGDKQSLFVF